MSVIVNKKRETKWYQCAAEGCTSDDRKRAKYPYMKNVTFSPFPTAKKNPKMRQKWLQLLRRDERFFEPNPKQIVCSLHFVEGKPTENHPYPELFEYNNFRDLTSKYGTSPVMQKSSAVDKWVKSRNSDREQRQLLRIDPPTIGPVLRFHPMAVKEVTVQTQTVKSVKKSCLLPEAEEIPIIGPDHTYSCNAISEPSPVFRYQSCQTTLTGNDIHEMVKLKGKKDTILRETVVDIVTKDGVSVRKYTGIPSKSQLHGLFGVLDDAAPKLKYWSGKHSAEDVRYQDENVNIKNAKIHQGKDRVDLS